MKSVNLFKSVNSFEISEIRVNSTDFKIRTPFWELVTPREYSYTFIACLHQYRIICTNFVYWLIINLRLHLCDLKINLQIFRACI